VLPPATAAALLLVVATGAVMSANTWIRSCIEAHAVDSERTLRLQRLKTAHSFYLRFECLLYVTITRYTLAAFLCGRLAFDDSLSGSVGTLLLLHSILLNLTPLLVFILFGLGDGASVAAPLSLAYAVVGNLSSSLSKLAPAPLRNKNSFATEELRDLVERQATGTGYGEEIERLPAGRKRDAAIATIQRYRRASVEPRPQDKQQHVARSPTM